MESQQPVNPTTAKPGNRNVIIIVGVAILLCCCIVVVVVGAYYAYQSYQATAQSFNDFAPDISQPPATSPSVDVGSSDLPQGGITDDLLRKDTWQYLGIAALAQSCEPDAAGTTIDVTQEPDAVGIWIERWTVACADGSTKAFDVTFTPDPNGGTNLHVETAK